MDPYNSIYNHYESIAIIVSSDVDFKDAYVFVGYQKWKKKKRNKKRNIEMFKMKGKVSDVSELH